MVWQNHVQEALGAWKIFHLCWREIGVMQLPDCPRPRVKWWVELSQWRGKESTFQASGYKRCPQRCHETAGSWASLRKWGKDREGLVSGRPRALCVMDRSLDLAKSNKEPTNNFKKVNFMFITVSDQSNLWNKENVSGKGKSIFARKHIAILTRVDEPNLWQWG